MSILIRTVTSDCFAAEINLKLDCYANLSSRQCRVCGCDVGTCSKRPFSFVHMSVCLYRHDAGLAEGGAPSLQKWRTTIDCHRP